MEAKLEVETALLFPINGKHIAKRNAALVI